MGRLSQAAALGACLIMTCASAASQSSPTSLRIGSLTFTGSVRERYEAWDWFQASGENSYGYSGTLIRFAFSQLKPHYDWTVELAAPLLLGLPREAVDASPQGQLGLGASYFVANDNHRNAAFIFPKQAFLRLKTYRSSWQIGRFEFVDGGEVKPGDPTLSSLKSDRISQRLIGTFGFSDVMRSFDGVHYIYSDGQWNVTVVGAIPTRGVFQVDGWGWVNTPIGYAAVTKKSAINGNPAEWRIFGLFYNDDRPLLKVDSRPLAVRSLDVSGIDIATFGGHYISAVTTRQGTVDVLGWGAFQTGKWGMLTQRSGAGALEAGIQPQFAKPVRPWLRGGYFYSTGDSNGSDRVHGTFFAVLPTPRVYARFPFFNSMNLRDLFAELILRPRGDLTLRTDAHGLSLASGNDLWYSGGGAFQPSTFGFIGRPSGGATGLANLYDISADYQWKYGVSAGIYFGFAQGHRVIENIYPKNPDGMLSFLELDYHF